MGNFLCTTITDFCYLGIYDRCWEFMIDTKEYVIHSRKFTHPKNHKSTTSTQTPPKTKSSVVWYTLFGLYYHKKDDTYL